MHYIKQFLLLNPMITHDHLLLLSVLFFLASIALFSLNKIKLSFLFLFVGSILLNFVFIQLDPFLNSWDERFHALVAKNLSEHPFQPMLYANPLIANDFKNWTGNHIWLHKQPLFLWQIALSIKIFGVSEMSVRLPSAVMLSLLIPALFRLGKLLFNEQVAFIAALLLVTNNFILEHVSGKQQLDHNDVAFMFYLTLSIWAWVEYEKSSNRWWLVAAGVFSGCGILIKWLTALLFYSAFGLYHLFYKKNLFQRETIYNLLGAACATFLVAIPWQAYIFLRYPDEARFEYAFNSRHFFEVIEGHGGNFFFYLKELGNHYSFLYLFIFLGVAFAAYNFRRNALAIAVFMSITGFYLFFSLAATKMTSFVMPVAPLCFLFIAFALFQLLELIRNFKSARKLAIALCLSFILFRNLNVDEIASSHWRNPESKWGRFFQNTADNVITNKKLSTIVPDDCVVVYCNQFEEIDCMFYSGVTAYSYLDESKFARLKLEGKKIAVFNNNLPEFVIGDSNVYIIPADYKVNKSGL
jgi:4-amino-4-deoxy-L-arabinose transferase-like glycosyltransferase